MSGLLTHPDLQLVCSDAESVPSTEMLNDFARVGAVLWVMGEPSNERLSSAVTEVRARMTGAYSGESSATWWLRELRSTREKSALLNDARAYLESKKATGHRALHAIDVADELLTNAFYDAPVDDQNQRTHRHVHRGEQVDLPADRPIFFGVTVDGKKLAIRVTDKFGSLEIGAVASYLDKRKDNRRAAIDAKQGGSGLGLMRIVESADEVWVRVQPWRETIVEARWDWSIAGASRVRRAEFNMLCTGHGTR